MGRCPAAEARTLTTSAGEQLSRGDRVATRRNVRELDVANRDTWTVAAVGEDGSLVVRGRGGERTLPAEYATRHVELAFATTVHGAQGDTVDHAHLLIGETTGAASAYVGMTGGRRSNTAHLVAEDLDKAREQWTEVFSRDRADLGPAHASTLAREAIDRYGPKAPEHATGGPVGLQAAALRDSRHRAHHPPVPAAPPPGPGIGR